MKKREFKEVDFSTLPKGTKVKVPCCECGATITIGDEDSYYCELCYQEQWVRWLKNSGDVTRDGEPDGHTPAMTPDVREKHNLTYKQEVRKLLELRKRFPERTEAYELKNKGNWYMAPYQFSPDDSAYWDARGDTQ